MKMYFNEDIDISKIKLGKMYKTYAVIVKMIIKN